MGIVCAERTCDPIHSDVNTVLTFLTHLYDSGLGFSALKSARSALSSVVILDNNNKRTDGSYPSVCKFMKGVSEMRPCGPRSCETWEVSLLLNYFHEQDVNEKLSLKDLTLKLSALLLLSGQRVQTIHVLKLSSIQFHDSGCRIRIMERLKQFDEKKNDHLINFSMFEQDGKLCVVRCIKEYIQRT